MMILQSSPEDSSLRIARVRRVPERFFPLQRVPKRIRLRRKPRSRVLQEKRSRLNTRFPSPDPGCGDFSSAPWFLSQVPRAFRFPASVSERPGLRRKALNRIPARRSRMQEVLPRGVGEGVFQTLLSSRNPRVFQDARRVPADLCSGFLRVLLLFRFPGTQNRFARSFFCLSGKVL